MVCAGRCCTPPVKRAHYFPKHKSETRSDDYYLNRILAPILRVIAPRWRTHFLTCGPGEIIG